MFLKNGSQKTDVLERCILGVSAGADTPARLFSPHPPRMGLFYPCNECHTPLRASLSGRDNPRGEGSRSTHPASAGRLAVERSRVAVDTFATPPNGSRSTQPCKLIALDGQGGDGGQKRRLRGVREARPRLTFGAMLQSRATHLVIANLLVQLGQPLPKPLATQIPLVAAVPETHVVLGMHWVEGVPAEPAGWEILTSPAYLFELVAKTEFPELVFRAVQLLVALGNVKTDGEKKAMVAEAYEGLSSEEQTAFQKILNDIDTVRRKLGGTMDATTTAVWVRPELVSASLRLMSVEQGASLYVARRQLESRTILETEKLLEDEEDDDDETPGGAAEVSTTAAAATATAAST